MANTIAQKVSKQRTLQSVDTEKNNLRYTIDASGRSLGRVASEAASALLGKKSAHYVQNLVLPVEVTVTNADKVALSERRIAGKIYQRYTGYPGGLKETNMASMIDNKGKTEVLRIAIDGMLPRNKLRKDRMKRLTIVA
jgi:large subunit ribosomal protein L13